MKGVVMDKKCSGSCSCPHDFWVSANMTMPSVVSEQFQSVFDRIANEVEEDIKKRNRELTDALAAAHTARLQAQSVRDEFFCIARAFYEGKESDAKFAYEIMTNKESGFDDCWTSSYVWEDRIYKLRMQLLEREARERWTYAMKKWVTFILSILAGLVIAKSLLPS